MNSAFLHTTCMNLMFIFVVIYIRLSVHYECTCIYVYLHTCKWVCMYIILAYKLRSTFSSAVVVIHIYVWFYTDVYMYIRICVHVYVM